jgi:predicted Zn finger-like uncharacterized protein
MIITCPSCQTRFRLDPDRFGPSGARIRCSACKVVFRLAPSGEVSLDGAPPPTSGPSGPALAVRSSPPRSAPRPAPAPVALASDPFAPVPAAPSTSDRVDRRAPDPFAQDPFAADLGPDPFSLGDARTATPAQVQRAADALQATLAPRQQPPRPPIPPPAVDPDALSLEDVSTPPPRSAPPPLPRPPALEPGLSVADEVTGAVGLPEAAGPPSPLDGLAGDPLAPGLALEAPAAPLAPVAAAQPVPAPPAPSCREAEADAAGHTAALPRLRRRTGVAALAANSLSLGLLLALTAGLLLWRGDVGQRLRVAVVGGGGDPVEPVGVHAGLYDTSGGPAVLVVRGGVLARSDAPGPLRVRVALVDGSRTVLTGEALAGASASPEEVFAASTADDAAALRRALDARAVHALRRGAEAPFLVLFPAPVPDLSGLEVRTAVEAVPEQ